MNAREDTPRHEGAPHNGGKGRIMRGLGNVINIFWQGGFVGAQQRLHSEHAEKGPARYTHMLQIKKPISLLKFAFPACVPPSFDLSFALRVITTYNLTNQWSR